MKDETALLLLSIYCILCPFIAVAVQVLILYLVSKDIYLWKKEDIMFILAKIFGKKIEFEKKATADKNGCKLYGYKFLDKMYVIEYSLYPSEH